MTTKSKKKPILRGEVYMCNLGEPKGRVQGGTRPVVVIQNNYGNQMSDTVIVAPVTSKQKVQLPTHFSIELGEESTVLTEQIVTINRNALQTKNRLHYLGGKEMLALDLALKTSLGIV